MFINMGNKIHAIHLFTKEKVIVTSELVDQIQFLIGNERSSAIAIDATKMKLYFEKNNGIWMREISRAEENVIIKNANVEKMAIDWIGRRIFWTESSSKRISVATLDGKERRILTNTINNPRGIAIDSTLG